MVNNLVNFFLKAFKGISDMPFGKELTVFIISLFPIIELRGGLIAAALLNIDPVVSYILCFLGNILPVPFILWLIKRILDWMRETKFFKKIVLWLDRKVDKNKAKIEKYGFWGLVIFVGIPLPGTGAWTGCLIAAMLEMDKKKAFLAAVLGVLMAGVIMMFVSFGVLKGIVG